MKLLIALALFAGVAYGNSTGFYGWQPNRELVFRFESLVENGIPEIREQHKAGIRFTAAVRVQTFNDYSLRIKFEQPKYTTVNGVEEQPQEEQIPPVVLQHLVQPFKVQLKRGVFEALYVDQSEPVIVTNLKKAFLANINLDITASRRPLDNKLEVLPSGQGPSYFVVREKSLHGDCKTSYSVHPLPKAEAMELEQQLLQEEETRNGREHLPGGLSQAPKICLGKPYYQITKTKNFDDCVERPVYQKWTGIRAKCDTTTSSCQELMNHVSATNYIVCGELEDFVIRKAVTKNSILASLAWNTEQKFLKSARVVVELVRSESVQTPLPTPPTPKEFSSLTFEYVRKSLESSMSINQLLPEHEKNRIEQQTGIRPVLPMPDLKSAPFALIPVKLTKVEIAQQVTVEMERIAREIFESPQSCSSQGDAAGHLSSMAKIFATLSYDDLKYVYGQVESKVAHINLSPESRQSLMSLLNDVLAMTGTNPSVMLSLEKIKITLQQPPQLRYSKIAINMLQTTLKNIKTPTQELLLEIVKFVKVDLKQVRVQYPTVYTVALTQVSTLLFRTCVSPTSRITETPARIYGPFCLPDTDVLVRNWIPYLAQEVEQETDSRIKLATLTALGKVGHMKAVKPIADIISSKTYQPLIRTLAVYSLKRVARVEPANIKHLLLTLIDNPAERPEVRIAAVAVLPFAQPTTSELQKIAIRAWFEPSKEVASYISSTLISLMETKVPELKPIGQKIRPIVNVVKPLMYGLRYSQNLHAAKFVKYLQTAISSKFAWIMPKGTYAPSYIAMSSRVFGGAFELNGASMTTFTEGLDKWLHQILYYSGYTTVPSPEVRQELTKITQTLKIAANQIQKPEIFTQLRLLDSEYFVYLNEAELLEMVQKVSDELNKNPNYLYEKKDFEISSAIKAVEAEGFGVSDAGFLISTKRSIPVVYAIKGWAQLIKSDRPNERLPQAVKIQIMPVVNIKLEASMGVVSPFTNELIGSGVDMGYHQTLPIEIELSRRMGQVTFTVQTPQQVQQEIEAIHLYIKPYTTKMPLNNISPYGKSTNTVPIVTGQPLKKLDLPIGESLGLNAKLIGESDNKYNDLYSYLEQIYQHSPSSLPTMLVLPNSLKKSSAKIVYNPLQSSTKQLSVSFSYMNVQKDSVHSDIKIHMPVASQPISMLTDMHLIKEVCKEVYPKSDMMYGQCIMQLSAIEVVADSAREICKLHPFADCHKYVQICEQAEQICESAGGFKTPTCKAKKNACLNRIISFKVIHKTLMEMGNSGSVHAIRVEAAVKSKSQFLDKTIETTLAFGSKTSVDGKVIDLASNLEVKPSTQSKPFYVKMKTQTQLPQIASRWNVEQIVKQQIQLLLDAKVEYGYEQTSSPSKMELKAKMERSPQQAEAVLTGPLYHKCMEEHVRHMPLSPVCQILLQQAGALDTIDVHFNYPPVIDPMFSRFSQYARAYFIALLNETIHSTPLQPGQLRLMANFSLAGDEAQVKAIHGNTLYQLTNIRLSQAVFKNLLPVPVRNPVSQTLLQKVTHNQLPAVCRVSPQFISTFDNKTYGFELDQCWHLLVKDRTEQLPIAVLARGVPHSPLKDVKILSGKSIVKLIHKSGQLTIQVDLEGQKKTIQIQRGYTEKITIGTLVAIKVTRYHDDVYLVDLPQQNLWVLTDGKQIEVSPPHLLRARAAGLCGDMNGENTLDLLTPGKCQMSKPVLAAYSYMIPLPTCQGIPASIKPQYEKELRECVKEEILPTPLNKLIEIVAPTDNKVPKPILSAHIVEKKHLQICISQEKLRVCPNTPVIGPPTVSRQRLLRFVCLKAFSLKAQQLEKLAKSGETLTTELMAMSVSYTKIMYEPTTCSAQWNRI